MDNSIKNDIIKTSWQLHNQIEHSYINHTATQGDDDWLEKQRLLLADMSLHLLQTALTTENLELDKLKNNLHAILTICDQYLPYAELKLASEKLSIE